MTDESKQAETNPTGPTESDAPSHGEGVGASGATKEPPPGAAPARVKPAGRQKKGKKEKKKYDSINAYLWHEWIKPLGIIFIVLGSFRSAIADWNDVPSGSMEPEVLTGDRIGVDKRAFGIHVPFTKNKWLTDRWDAPDRGDIVVAYSPDMNDQVRIVKRVVGVPGDTIEVVDGRIVLNGEAVAYVEVEADVAGKYLSSRARGLGEFYEELLPASDPSDEDGVSPHYVRYAPDAPKNRSFGPITLGEDEFFFMGDNRDESKDGRVYGVTPGDRIVGRAFGVAFSLNHDQFFLPRVTRFFSGLR